MTELAMGSSTERSPEEERVLIGDNAIAGKANSKEGDAFYLITRKLLEENWRYDFDDSHILPINKDDVKSSAAYVLFYRRAKSDASTSDAA